jgi:dihydrofolate reductase
MKIAIIVAVAEKNIIGSNNTMPWHCPADLQYFKRTTMGAPVLMGRKTYQSLHIKPLPGRQNIVITRDENFAPADCDVVHSVNAGLACAGKRKPAKVFVIGGADIYRQVIGIADELYVTQLELKVAGDRYFPEISTQQWCLESSTPYHVDEMSPYNLVFKKFVRHI